MGKETDHFDVYGDIERPSLPKNDNDVLSSRENSPKREYRNGGLSRSNTCMRSPRHDGSPTMLMRSHTFVPGALRQVESAPHHKSNASSAHASSAHRSQTSSGLRRLRSYDFNAKASFDASQHLLKSRSDSFLLGTRPPDNDIWKRSPPDFRPQIYAPKPPKRNSRDAMRPWSYTGYPEDYVRVTANEYNEDETEEQCGQDDDLPPFETRIRLSDAWDGKLDYARHGMHPADAYKSPQPHDFRGYPPISSLGLPEFVTANDHDPYKIHFLSQRLNTIHGLSIKSPLDRWKGKQMFEPLRQPPNWESRLILPHNPFPNRYAAYTRYRVPNRSPHSALMERIEDNLTSKWAREKMERALQVQAQDS